MRDSWTRGTLRLGLLLMLTMGLVLPALIPAGSAQGTPEAEPTVEPTATLVPDPTVEPTVVTEPTTDPDPTETPAVEATTATEPTSTEAPASRVGILAEDPLTLGITGSATVRPGDTLAYTITVTNTSGRSALSLGAWDYLPDTGADWTIGENSFEGGCQLQTGPTFLYCSIEDAPDGASYSVTVESVIPDIPGEALCANGLSNQANGDIWLGLTDHHGLESSIVTTDVVCESPTPFTIVVTGPDTIHPGEQLTYTYTVTNTSGRDFANIDLNSSLPASLTWSVVEDETNATSCIYTPDEVENYLFCYGTGVLDGTAMTVTVAATIPSGTACGTAYAVQARGKAAYSYTPPPPEYTDAFDSNTVTTNVVCNASIELAKSGVYVTPSTDAPLGAIDWVLTVTNTGDVALTGAEVTDAGVTDLDCDPETDGNQTTIASLDPGTANAVTCTATRPVSATESGTTVTNNASVTGFHGNIPVSDTASAEVSVPALTGGIEITKTVTNQPVDGFDFEETVTYDIIVANTGDVPLFGVAVSDDQVTDLDCGTGTTGSTVTLAQLDPGEANAVTCTASAIFPAPNANQPHPNAIFANMVTVSAPFGDTTLSDSATANATPGRTAISIDSRTEPNPVTAPGPVTATYTVENIGTTTQLNLALTAPLPFDCDPGTPGDQDMPNTLAPGATVTCTAILEATQADIDVGDPLSPGEWRLTTFTGTPWFEDPIRTDVDQQPELTLAKSVDPVAIDAAGDVTWSFLATNTGNVTLTNLALDDPGIDLETLDCDAAVTGNQPLPASLVPHDAVTCTSVSTITQAEVDTRQPVTNTAQVTSDQATSNIASATVTITPRDGLGLVLSVDPGTVDGPTSVTWTYALTNSGTSTLTNLVIEDAAIDLATLDCDPADGIQQLPASLAPETSVTCISAQAIDQVQVDAGDPITREAVATSTETASNQARATVSIIQAPGIGLTKTVTSATSGLLPGDVVTYDIVLTNTGNVTVANPAIEDAEADTLDCGDGATTLTPQATVSCIATYTLTETDLLRGSYTNTVSAEATVGQGTAETIRTFRQSAPVVVEATASATVTMAPVEVGLEIGKSVTPAGPVGSGATLTYTFVVTNTGNLSLNNVAVSDLLSGLVWDTAYPDGVIGELAAGETTTLTATYVVTSADAASGEITNTAIADGVWACQDMDTATFSQAGSTPDCAVISEPASVATIIIPDPAPPSTPTPPSTPKAADDTVVTVLPATGHGPDAMHPLASFFGIAAALILMVLALTCRVGTRPTTRSRASDLD